MENAFASAAGMIIARERSPMEISDDSERFPEFSCLSHMASERDPFVVGTTQTIFFLSLLTKHI